MEYSKKLLYQSNQWYNDGLKKANIRDLSGAILSLKRSLQYNRDNVPARNLLGLVYYGRGEVVEALVEWVISKNIQSHANIATYYIKKVQEAQGELEMMNQAIQKYNQCLVYCEQGGEDLAAIQLRKVLSMHPSFVRAYQLLALIYMVTEQYAKARQMLRKAHKLDTTNEITLRYMHELKQLHSDKAAKLKEVKDQSVSYKLGNETIIQPISNTLKDNATIMTIVNIVIGLVVGVAFSWFLIVPAVRQEMTAKNNKSILAYSEQIAALESEVDLINKELGQYVAESEATAEEKEIAQKTQGSYEALVAALAHYYDESYKRSELVDELLLISPTSLGTVGKTTYDTMTADVYARECEELFKTAKRNCEVANYKAGIPKLERVLKMQEGYADGEAMLILMKAYHDTDETEKAKTLYDRILELYPDTELATKAKEIIG